MRNRNPNPSVFERIYLFFGKRWVLFSIVSFVPTIWFSLVIKYLGEALGLKEIGIDAITPFGWFLTVIILGLSLMIILSNNFKANKHNKEIDSKLATERDSIRLLENMMRYISKICLEKYNRFIIYISKHKTGDVDSPFDEITQPKQQLNVVVNCIASFFYDILHADTRIRQENIIVSLAYAFNNEEPWVWLNTMNIQGGLTLNELKKNNKTAFYQVYVGERDLVFYNDKSIAIENYHYVADQKDKRYKNEGSIVCKEICCGDGTLNYIRGILSVSTYGVKFVNTDDPAKLKTVEETIDIVLEQFEERIKIEFGLLYIKNIYGQKDAPIPLNCGEA